MRHRRLRTQDAVSRCAAESATIPRVPHGTSHLARMPSLVAVSPHIHHEDTFAAQAIQNDDGSWVVSVIAPQSIHWHVAPDDAREMLEALQNALFDYERLRQRD